MTKPRERSTEMTPSPGQRLPSHESYVAAAQSTAAFLNPAGLKGREKKKKKKKKSPFSMKCLPQVLLKLEKMTPTLI